MFSLITQNLIWSEGIRILVVSLIGIGLGFFYSRVLLVSAVAILLFSIFFFRNPSRNTPRDSNSIISPSDGIITSIAYDSSSPDGEYHIVSIFLSPFDVHVNRIPLTGSVKKVAYVPGAFMFAFLPKSSHSNEHNDVWFSDMKGRTVRVRQIAGFIARRICCWVRSFQMVTAGEPFGMIKFGSRVDVFLPDTAQITCEVGQRIRGGESIIGTWK